MIPGEIILADEAIPCNVGREAIRLAVENTSDHTVYVTSHYHFMEANKRLRFNRTAAYGRRLDVPAGSGVRWASGEVKDVELIGLGGRRRVYGFQGFVNGALSTTQVGEATARCRAGGFLDVEEE